MRLYSIPPGNNTEPTTDKSTELHYRCVSTYKNSTIPLHNEKSTGNDDQSTVNYEKSSVKYEQTKQKTDRNRDENLNKETSIIILSFIPHDLTHLMDHI